jgi:hypothetical protein
MRYVKCGSKLFRPDTVTAVHLDRVPSSTSPPEVWVVVPGENRQEREHWWEKDRARCKQCSRAIRGRRREDYGGMVSDPVPEGRGFPAQRRPKAGRFPSARCPVQGGLHGIMPFTLYPVSRPDGLEAKHRCSRGSAL